ATGRRLRSDCYSLMTVGGSLVETTVGSVGPWGGKISWKRRKAAVPAHQLNDLRRGVAGNVRTTRNPGPLSSSCSAAPCNSATALTRLRPRPEPGLVRLPSNL